MDKVYNFLKNNIQDECIVVGVSGGVDSMVLLSILQEQLHCKIICAHVHHNLRVESDEELEFVKEYCRNNNIIFEFKKLEYDEKFSEEVARTKRYCFFEEILKKYSSKTLLTAHHGDDLIETIMMKIVRGSTIKGYRGIEKVSPRDNYKILRPLLYSTKKDIYEYAKEHQIPYREDYTNDLDEYTRNRYRKYLLPFLKQENKDVHLKFLEYSDELSAYYEYVNHIIDDEYNKSIVNNQIVLSSFLSLDEFIQKELLKRYLFVNYADNIIKFNNQHLNIILKFLRDKKTNTKINLPDNYWLIIEYDIVSLRKNIDSNEYCYEIKNIVELANGRRIEIVKESSDNSNFTTHLDLANIKLPLYVRNYKHGDKLIVKNMSGHKKISDIFTNEKVNLSDRASWPVVVDAKGEIIWLPGLKKTQFDRKNTEKYDIILKYY